MVWNIKTTSILGSPVGTVYYKFNKRWTETYADRATYTSQAKAKAEEYIWKKPSWDVTAVNENA